MSFLSDLVEDRRRLNRVGGLVSIVIATLLLLTTLSYHGQDRPFFFSNEVVSEAGGSNVVTMNLFGRVGATAGETMLQLFGAGAFMFCALWLALGWQRVRAWEVRSGRVFSLTSVS